MDAVLGLLRALMYVFVNLRTSGSCQRQLSAIFQEIGYSGSTGKTIILPINTSFHKNARVISVFPKLETKKEQIACQDDYMPSL